jgi:hypothetical protein
LLPHLHILPLYPTILKLLRCWSTGCSCNH